MGDGTGIEWTDATWNPFVGCTAVSPGCDHCYAARQSSGRLKNTPTYTGLAEGGIFNGTIRLLPDRLDQPLRWTRPRRIFVNSMSDLFHEGVPDDYIARIFAVMAQTPQHTYQVLTKRHGRMRSLLSSARWPELLTESPEWPTAFRNGEPWGLDLDPERPLPNVWLGVSVENQQWADIRIPVLLGTPAAVRFLSCEPLIGAVTLHRKIASYVDGWRIDYAPNRVATPKVDWCIVGGESGPGARPVDIEWVRTLRDECVAGGVAFHFKQWGEYLPAEDARARDLGGPEEVLHSGRVARRVGKKIAGRDLDGRTWDEYPQIREEARP